MQQYIPVKEFTREVFIPSLGKSISEEQAHLTKTLFGGDQLTAARAQGAILAMANASSPLKRLQGMIPVIEDWHAQVVLLEVRLQTANYYIIYMYSSYTCISMQVIWKYFYSVKSSSEHSTMYQLRNLINKTNVGTNPKLNFNACDDFLPTVITGHILY